MSDQRHLTIMVLEDNVGDVILLKRALNSAKIDFTAVVFEDGESALSYLDLNASAGATTPNLDVAILDLNVPKRDGSEVLAHIRNSPKCQHIAAIMLSSSPQHVMMSQAAQADCYITKPNDLNEYLSIGGQIAQCIDNVQRANTLRKSAIT